MIRQSDPDLTAHLNERLRPNKPEQQNNTFCFATPVNTGTPEDHTPIQTRTLKELNVPKDKEKNESTREHEKNLETNFANEFIGLTHF